MKYLIPECTERQPNSEDRYWSRIHRDDKYRNVCSLTDDPAFISFILDKISDLRMESIWIPGCGSRTGLQEALCELADVKRVVCSDFQSVVELAEDNYEHPKLEYRYGDTRKINFEDEFDLIIVVNSILSASDMNNRMQLRSCFEALKSNGKLIGLFPTIFAAMELAELKGDNLSKSHVDFANSTKYEPAQDAFQIFYTPVRLRVIMREAGFMLENMMIYFLDSPFLLSHGANWREYVDDADLVVYELFITACKSE